MTQTYETPQHKKYRAEPIHSLLGNINSLKQHPHLQYEFCEVKIAGTVSKCTERGLLIEDPDYDPYWLPKQQVYVLRARGERITDGSELNGEPVGHVILPRWLAKKHHALIDQLERR